MFPTLDAHAHLRPSRTLAELADCGAVLAMGLFPEEADQALARQDSLIAWGPGCHPRFPRALQTFDPARFRAQAERMPFIGEVGLDTGARVPFQAQLATFRSVLAIAAELGRIVSIHSYRATLQTLVELERCPQPAPILHDWFGTAAETQRAVELGCYFSIHSQVARQSKFRLHVPLERVLLESDHGYDDTPAAIPCRVQWVEYLVAQQYGLEVMDLRRAVWSNFARLVSRTGVSLLLPAGFTRLLSDIPIPESGHETHPSL